MKIYKLLFLTVLSCFALSCSQDSFEDKAIDDTNDRVAASQFDNSYLGVYKGLFSTNDGLTRGHVVVTMSPTNEAIAQITLSTGEMIELKSSRIKLTVDNAVNNLRFSSAGLSNIDASLNFSVEGNGTNPSISGVSFDNKDSDILIAKNLSRAPLNTITGTYMRTAGTGGFPTSGRTWNVMSVGTNNQTYSTQIFYGGRLYNTTDSSNQTGCVDDGIAFVTCNINGSATILGYPVTWTGAHTYDRFTDNLGCSDVSGTWAAPTYGGSSGTFQSDSDCTATGVTNDFCEDASTIGMNESVVGFTDGGGFGPAATNGDTPTDCIDNLFGTIFDGAGVWYRFTSPVTDDITIDTEGTDDSVLDTQLRLFSGTCGSLVCIDNDDDDGTGLLSSITFSATAGETYTIFLGGYNGDTGTFQLNVTGPVPPLTCGDNLVDDGGFPGAYAIATTTTYNIDAGAGNVASLPFAEFDLEDGWDFIRIYDGDSDASPEITDVNGKVVANISATRTGFTGSGAAGANSLEGETVVSSTRYLTIVFVSDVSNAAEGFFAPVNCIPARSVAVNQRTSVEFVPERNANGYSLKEKPIVLIRQGQNKTDEYYESQH